MEPELGHNLGGKNVVTSEGAALGTLFNITIDLRSGELKKLLVTPERDIPTAKRPTYETDTNGRYKIPCENVESSDDCIVVS